MASSQPDAGPPALQLLAKGLEFWLRQQCDALASCHLQLRGSLLRLLQGKLEGVDLEAEGASYQQLRFRAVTVSSGPLAVRMGSLLRRQVVELEQPFRIEGQGRFRAEDLQASFVEGAWRPMAEAACQALLTDGQLSQLELVEGRLLLTVGGSDGAGCRVVAVTLAVVEGQLELQLAADGAPGLEACESNRRHRLPCAPHLRLQSVHIEGQELVIRAEAQVFPG